MPHALTKTVYYFDELSDKAKRNARDWYREGALQYDWWEASYDDAVQCAAVLGIEIDMKSEKWVNVSTHKEGVHTSPAIYFSGFASQGDGACFEGSYRYAKDAAKAIREHAPVDTELHRIADELHGLQSRHGYALEARVKHSGHYYHSRCTDIDFSEEGSGNEIAQETLAELLRDFMTWIYRQLETEHDYQLSDESVDDTIRANEYEFTENGERA